MISRYNKNIFYIILFCTFLILILIEGYLCKYTKLNFCNESFFFNFWNENGFIENLSSLFLFFAIIFLFKAQNLYRDIKFINIFLIIKILALIYFLGEEISWGQHFFKWTSPGFFKNANIQGETNIHNISNLFDQVPRTLVIIWCSLTVPITLLINKSQKINENLLKILCPDKNLKFLSIILLFFILPDLFVDKLGLHPGHVDALGQGIEASVFYDTITFNFLRLSEFHELIFTFYFFIYSLSIMKRKN